MTCIDLNDKLEIYGITQDLILKFTKNKLCKLSTIKQYLNTHGINISSKEIMNISESENNLMLLYGKNDIAKRTGYIHYKTKFLKFKRKISNASVIKYDHYVSNPDNVLRNNLTRYKPKTIYKAIPINQSNYLELNEYGWGFIIDNKVYKITWDIGKNYHKLIGYIEE